MRGLGILIRCRFCSLVIIVLIRVSDINAVIVIIFGCFILTNINATLIILIRVNNGCLP